MIFVTNSYTCMVSPGTHFVKNNFMSPSPETNESREVKKKKTMKLKMLGPLCSQTVNLKTDSVFQYSELKYSPSILKHNKG